ncbi:hypothetical protein CLOSTMETH_00097 [[Clostridium] methylpentosum DSM 5476]|uniref:Uncharacterized protein n=1 Tax=[Clostridium] methylpentosum DSM 5476 TaxID=537013 RepID=C0E8F2_9FIRM|nr:hypothetical protein CLOSTMETH_00097 [[Clostridium] methylpentosum DSM 5476]
MKNKIKVPSAQQPVNGSQWFAMRTDLCGLLFILLSARKSFAKVFLYPL